MLRSSFSKREKIILAISISLAAAFIFSQFIFKPVKEHEKGLLKRLMLDEQKLGKNTLILQRAKAINQQHEEFSKAIGESKSDENELSSMVSEIETVGGQVNVHIANMQPQKALSKGFHRRFAVRLTIDGNWSDITHFLHVLQGAPYYFDVEELLLEKYSTTTDALKGRLSLSRIRMIPQ